MILRVRKRLDHWHKHANAGQRSLFGNRVESVYTWSGWNFQTIIDTQGPPEIQYNMVALKSSHINAWRPLWLFLNDRWQIKFLIFTGVELGEVVCGISLCCRLLACLGVYSCNVPPCRRHTKSPDWLSRVKQKKILIHSAKPSFISINKSPDHVCCVPMHRILLYIALVAVDDECRPSSQFSLCCVTHQSVEAHMLPSLWCLGECHLVCRHHGQPDHVGPREVQTTSVWCDLSH